MWGSPYIIPLATRQFQNLCKLPAGIILNNPPSQEVYDAEVQVKPRGASRRAGKAVTAFNLNVPVQHPRSQRLPRSL